MSKNTTRTRRARAIMAANPGMRLTEATRLADQEHAAASRVVTFVGPALLQDDRYDTSKVAHLMHHPRLTLGEDGFWVFSPSLEWPTEYVHGSRVLDGDLPPVFVRAKAGAARRPGTPLTADDHAIVAWLPAAIRRIDALDLIARMDKVSALGLDAAGAHHSPTKQTGFEVEIAFPAVPASDSSDPTTHATRHWLMYALGLPADEGVTVTPHQTSRPVPIAPIPPRRPGEVRTHELRSRLSTVEIEGREDPSDYLDFRTNHPEKYEVGDGIVFKSTDGDTFLGEIGDITDWPHQPAIHVTVM